MAWSNLIKANGIDGWSPFWSAGSLLTNLTKSTTLLLLARFILGKLIVDNRESTSLAFNHPMAHGLEQPDQGKWD
jgi:hypothetical protein